MLQVEIGPQERQRLISKMAQLSTELNLERALRQKSEQLHQTLLRKAELLEEQSNLLVW